MSTNNYIGNKIKEIRLQYKMSQADLTEKLEVRNPIILEYERGVRMPSIDILIELKNLFNVPVSYFFNEEIEQNARTMLDVTDLTENQLLIIAKLYDEFTQYNKSIKKEDD